MLAATLIPLFVGACTILGGVGFFAVWAEFRSSAKVHEYDRYTYARG